MTNSSTHTRTRNTSRRVTPDALITVADLPTPVAERINTIVRATRLWKSERADIARELIAHAQDALSAGRTPEDTADSLGDPATIAKLLRRSARRKRPWHWQARHRTLQAIAIALLAMIGTYTILFIRFNTGSPSITHNYLAELNERNSVFTEDQKALPAFEALHQAWSPLYFGFYKIDAEYRKAEGLTDQPQKITAFEHYPFAPSDAPLYDRLLNDHANVRSQLDAYIAASRLPTLGFLYSDRYEEITLENGSTTQKVLPPSDNPSLSAPVIEVLLPWLGQARSITQLLAFDALVAAREGDPVRTLESLAALFDTVRLVAQEHTLIASLVAIACQTVGENMVNHILHHHPDLLDEAHLTKLAHTLGNSARNSRNIDLETENKMFYDLLQRSFTDNGHGDGRLTPDGVRIIHMYSSVEFDPSIPPPGPSLTTRLSGPIAMPIRGSRRDQREMHDRMMSHVHRAINAPPHRLADLGPGSEYSRLIDQLRDNPRYTFLSHIFTAMDRVAATVHKSHAHTNATLTAIALHIHHQRTGRWPDTLAELTPHLLPTIPEDPFDPGQPIKYRVIDGVPHIYFVGADGQDNHAARPTEATERDVSSLERRYMQGRTHPSPRPADRGDWVIFPPDSP